MTAPNVLRGDAPLLLSMPHSGLRLEGLESRLRSSWIARKDADWHIPELYAFAAELGATLVRTDVSRTVIDVNRDPTGRSLYPGQATTELCPTTTFDGEPLYLDGQGPDEAEIAQRRGRYFDPYHATLRAETARLRERHANVVLYDCHSIRSAVPRLFDGTLPQFNVGTNDGRACAPQLSTEIASICATSGFTSVVNGRFKGGQITRSHGDPLAGVHAVQMELSCRGYLREPVPDVDPGNWPAPFDAAFAEPLQRVIRRVLQACLAFARR